MEHFHSFADAVCSSILSASPSADVQERIQRGVQFFTFGSSGERRFGLDVLEAALRRRLQSEDWGCIFGVLRRLEELLAGIAATLDDDERRIGASGVTQAEHPLLYHPLQSAMQCRN